MTETFAPDADRIERLARATMARLPEAFRAHLGDIVLRVDDFAEEAVLAEMGFADPYELTGLYTGRPVGEKSIMDGGAMPDMIQLFRLPLLDEWIDTGVSLEALIAHVVIHEIGHHFGLSDADMHALEESVG